jgi:predicted transposase/invertase (TIGR01784 family)
MSEKWIDRSWRDILTENADDAILFFKPDLAADRDYGKKPFLVPPEFPAIGSDSDKGARISDLCLSVPLKTGIDQRVAFSIEQQHAYDKDFALRMFQGYYRMSDKLMIPVTSLAIFTGNIKPVEAYKVSCYGTKLDFRYNFYHVADADADELEKDDRVFALVALAAKRMLDAGDDPNDRGKYSLELLKLTRERGYAPAKTRNIQKFIYRILRVGDETIAPEVREVWKMRLIPIDEAVREIHIRDAKEEGIEEGIEEGKFEVARKMLARKMPIGEIVDLTGLSEQDIMSI